MISTDITAASAIYLGSVAAQKMYIGSTLIWQIQQQQQGLPAGYTQLAYIKSTYNGGQYIDLGLHLQENVGDIITCQTKFAIIDSGLNTTSLATIFQCRDETTSPYNGFTFRIKNNSSQIDCNRAGVTSIQNFPSNLYKANDFEKGSFTFDTGNSDFTIGTVSGTYSGTTTLFCAIDTNGDPFRYCEGIISYLKIKKNGILIKDLIPAKNSNNIAGLYDLISNIFYTSQSNTPFEGEEIITLPSGYQRLYNINSTTGGQYINLNTQLYSSSPNFDYEIKFLYRGNGSGNHNQSTLFNCMNDVSPYPGIFIRRSSNNVVARVGDGTQVTIGTVGTTSDKIITYNYDQTTGYNDKNTTFTENATLFCYLNSSGTPARFTRATLFYFKLWENGILTRDLIPCLNNNNVVGMYDLVNDIFYSSSSDASFVAGPIV